MTKNLRLNSLIYFWVISRTSNTTTINDNLLHFSSQSNNLIRILRVPTNLVLLNDNNNAIKMQKHLQPTKPAIHPKVTNVKKLKTRRDDFRRVQHNQIERARREKINNLIVELSRKIPETDESSTQKNGDMLSKGGILEKASEYITLLKIKNESLLRSSATEKYNDLQELREENDLLKKENIVLKKRLISLECIHEHSKPEEEHFKMEYELEPSDTFINI